MISRPGDQWNCRLPAEVFCAYSIGSEDQINIHIIKESSSSGRFFPAIRAGSQIKEISIWNWKSDEGDWNEITTEGKLYFDIDPQGNLTTRNLNMDVWAGNVAKITFGDHQQCALVKFKGDIFYPIDIEKFKHSLRP